MADPKPIAGGAAPILETRGLVKEFRSFVGESIALYHCMPGEKNPMSARNPILHADAEVLLAARRSIRAFRTAPRDGPMS